MREVYSTWTNAPSDYDYSYAMRTGKTKDDGQTEVWLETCEANASGQVVRYRSGLHVATAPVRVEDPGAVVLAFSLCGDDGERGIGIVTLTDSAQLQIRRGLDAACRLQGALQIDPGGPVAMYLPSDELTHEQEAALETSRGIRCASAEAAVALLTNGEEIDAEALSVDLNLTPGTVQWIGHTGYAGGDGCTYVTQNCCGEVDYYLRGSEVVEEEGPSDADVVAEIGGF